MSTPHNRREFIRRAALGAAGASLGAGVLGRFAGTSHAQTTRPNVLFILTDDQRFDAMSCVGNPPWLRTPNMDRIRNEGALFSNAFVTISLCSPSRASFLTGCYAHTHNVRTNEANDPDPALATFPMVLRQAGYRTGFIGKWHMAPKASPRPGFDYWLSFRGQGEYNNPSLNENGRDFQAEGYMTDLLTEYALSFLGARSEQPFCLILSHKAVHGPFTPAERHRELYAGETFPEPPNARDDFADKPEWIRAGMVRGIRREAMAENADKPVPHRIPPTDWNPRVEGRLNYYRSLAAVDEGIGRVLDLLAQQGRLDNTVVVFAGDNGYFHGEHRRGDKRLMYEESLRIPFTMRYPALVQPGTTIDEMVLSIDLAPTLEELAGARVPDSVQGESFARLLRGQRGNWRSSFLYEYFQEGWLPGIPTMFGVRTERWKYITYPKINDIDEMYDLETDPHELTNLAENPAYADKKQELKAELERLLKETDYQEAPRPKVNKAGSVVLDFDFTQDAGDRVADRSGKGNHGTARGTQVVDADGRKARKFTGTDSISVDRSESLNPAGGPHSVEAWVKAEKDTGVILARGGQTNGYALFLRDGRPGFFLRIAGEAIVVRGTNQIGADWAHLLAVITNDAFAKLYVNGEEAGSVELDRFIPADPNEGLEVGMDRATLVGDYGADNGFTGLIRRVRVWDGHLTPEKAHACAAEG